MLANLRQSMVLQGLPEVLAQGLNPSTGQAAHHAQQGTRTPPLGPLQPVSPLAGFGLSPPAAPAAAVSPVTALPPLGSPSRSAAIAGHSGKAGQGLARPSMPMFAETHMAASAPHTSSKSPPAPVAAAFLGTSSIQSGASADAASRETKHKGPITAAPVKGARAGAKSGLTQRRGSTTVGAALTWNTAKPSRAGAAVRAPPAVSAAVPPARRDRRRQPRSQS